MRLCSAQDENNMRRWLFERFEQRIKRRRRKHVNFVDNIYLVRTFKRRIINAIDDLFTHVVYTRARSSVELKDIGMNALRYIFTGFAHATRQTILRRCAQ